MIVEILAVQACPLGFRLHYYRPDTATTGAVILPPADRGLPALRRGQWARLERRYTGVAVIVLAERPARGRGWSWRRVRRGA